jgi:hypothetical protein
MKSSPVKPASQERTDASQQSRERLAEAWREARDQTADAYRHWCDAPIAQRRIAYAVYVAAADRESAAEASYRATLRASARGA